MEDKMTKRSDAAEQDDKESDSLEQDKDERK